MPNEASNHTAHLTDFIQISALYDRVGLSEAISPPIPRAMGENILHHPRPTRSGTSGATTHMNGLKSQCTPCIHQGGRLNPATQQCDKQANAASSQYMGQQLLPEFPPYHGVARHDVDIWAGDKCNEGTQEGASHQVAHLLKKHRWPTTSGRPFAGTLKKLKTKHKRATCDTWPQL